MDDKFNFLFAANSGGINREKVPIPIPSAAAIPPQQSLSLEDINQNNLGNNKRILEYNIEKGDNLKNLKASANGAANVNINVTHERSTCSMLSDHVSAIANVAENASIIYKKMFIIIFFLD